MIRNIIAYTGSGLVAQVFQFVQYVLVRRFLSPVLLGYWNYVEVVHAFVHNFDMGFGAAAVRKLLLVDGKGLDKEFREVASTYFWANLAQAAVFALGILVYGIVVPELGKEKHIALWVAASFVILASAVDAFTIILQSKQSYILLGKLQVFRAVILASLIPAGAWVWGIHGLFLATIVAYAVIASVMAIACIRAELVFYLPWRLQLIKSLLKVGLPLRIADLPLGLFVMMDGLYITGFLGLEALAIYMTAKSFVFAISDIPGRMGRVVLSRIFYKTGKGAERKQLGHELVEYLMVQYLVILPVIILLSYEGMGLLVNLLIPQYQESLYVFALLLLLYFFMPQTSLVRNFWTLDKKMLRIGLSNIVGLLGMAIGIFGGSFLCGENIVSVAYGVLFGYVVFHVYLVLTVGTESWGRKNTLIIMAISGLSCIYTAAVMAYVSTDAIDVSWSGVLLNTFRETTLGMAMLAPMFLIGGRRAYRFYHQAKNY